MPNVFQSKKNYGVSIDNSTPVSSLLKPVGQPQRSKLWPRIHAQVAILAGFIFWKRQGGFFAGPSLKFSKYKLMLRLSLDWLSPKSTWTGPLLKQLNSLLCQTGPCKFAESEAWFGGPVQKPLMNWILGEGGQVWYNKESSDFRGWPWPVKMVKLFGEVFFQLPFP